MLHRRLVSLSRHGGATGIVCRIFDECTSVSECGEQGGACTREGDRGEVSAKKTEKKGAAPQSKPKAA
jgi:hypothetical protein